MSSISTISGVSGHVPGALARRGIAITRPRALAALSPALMRTPAKRRVAAGGARGSAGTLLSPMASAAAAASARAHRQRARAPNEWKPSPAPPSTASAAETAASALAAAEAAAAAAAVPEADSEAARSLELAQSVVRAHRRHLDDTLVALQEEMGALALFEQRLVRGKHDAAAPLSVMHSQRYLVAADAGLARRGKLHSRMHRHIRALRAKCAHSPSIPSGKGG